MKTILNDPLLSLARIGTILVQIALIIGQVALGVAFAVTVAGTAGWLPEGAEIRAGTDFAEFDMAFAAVAIFAAMVALGLMTIFVVILRQIIDTVGKGDPFVADNAARLTRMAWLALGAQLIGLAVTIMETAASSRFEEDFEVHSEASLTGFGLVLVLFILARVFRQGAAMRADLEGTV